jgi:O-acetyl-ADP-ribose deacetylase (regulator of RNase III)
MISFLFFDWNNDKIDGYRRILHKHSNIIFFNGSLDQLIEQYDFDILVSPANSFGVMNGGIDKDIAKQWPDVAKNVLDKVKCSNYSDNGNRQYIPVGKCEIVYLDNKKKDKFLLIAPTMYGPQKIVGTQNVALAFSAIINLIKNITYPIVIACPCLGTGVGCMTGDESAKQIDKVLQNYRSYINL